MLRYFTGVLASFSLHRRRVSMPRSCGPILLSIVGLSWLFAVAACSSQSNQIPQVAQSPCPGTGLNEQLSASAASVEALNNSPQFDYRIGPEDLLEISVFEVPELSRTVRVSASGEISLPLVGTHKAAGLTQAE